jgi:SAM-dependent methyltransferase
VSSDAFSGKASAYAAARPSYPIAAVNYLLEMMPPDGVVADIGAGTGKLTELLAGRGVEVYGVEPNDDMRLYLTDVLADYPNATALVGSAENTGLPDKSVDLIVCAQALHWFDPASFWAECRRIGKPDAVVAAVYNNMDGGRGGLHRQVATDSFFSDPEIVEFDSTVSYSRDSWREYMLSHSHSPLPTDDNYADYLSEIDIIFNSEQVDGKLTRPVTTTVYAQPVFGPSVETMPVILNAVSASPDGGIQPSPDPQLKVAKKGRVLRPRHWVLIAATALLAIAEIWHLTHMEASDNVPRVMPTAPVTMPLADDASDEEILSAFEELCGSTPEAVPEYDDRFTAAYACPVEETYLWISIDRGHGDYLRYVTLPECFEELEPTNTISGGRWMIDMDNEAIPDHIVQRLNEGATRWYCPPEEDDELQ